MKLSKVAILALRGLGVEDRKRLAKEMNLTENTFYRWIKNNDDNLTKAGYLYVIRRELGLDEEAMLETEGQI